jgi:hypothetical protein
MENYIGGVIVSVLASSSVDRKFNPWSGQSSYKELTSQTLSIMCRFLETFTLEVSINV